MTPDRAAELFVGEAARYLDVREVPTGSNRGTCIDYWVRECGLDPAVGAAWCAAFVGQMGRQAVGAAWPCPRTAAVHDPQRRWASLVTWAEDAKALVADPARGDLIVLWHGDLGRFAHVGIVESIARPGDGRVFVKTLEGNANPAGGREGYGVFRLTRQPDARTRYVRWTAKLGPA